MLYYCSGFSARLRECTTIRGRSAYLGVKAIYVWSARPDRISSLSSRVDASMLTQKLRGTTRESEWRLQARRWNQNNAGRYVPGLSSPRKPPDRPSSCSETTIPLSNPWQTTWNLLSEERTIGFLRISSSGLITMRSQSKKTRYEMPRSLRLTASQDWKAERIVYQWPRSVSRFSMCALLGSSETVNSYRPECSS